MLHFRQNENQRNHLAVPLSELTKIWNRVKREERKRFKSRVRSMGDLFVWLISFFILISLIVIVIFQVILLTPLLIFLYFTFYFGQINTFQKFITFGDFWMLSLLKLSKLGFCWKFCVCFYQFCSFFDFDCLLGSG